MHNTTNTSIPQTKNDPYEHSDNVIYINRKTRNISKEKFYQGLFHFLLEIELINNNEEFQYFILDNQANIQEFRWKYHIT